MEKTREALRKSKEREAKEKKESKKEKQIKKAFALFVDDTDDFIEVKDNYDYEQSMNLLFTGCVQEEKIRKIRSETAKPNQSSVLFLTADEPF